MPGSADTSQACTKLRVVVWWEYLSSYMAACWRELARHPQIDLFVIAKQPGLSTTHAAFDAGLLAGVPSIVMSPDAAEDWSQVAPHIERRRPDIIMLTGWTNRAYSALLSQAALADTPLVLAMDTPGFRRSWRPAVVRLKRRALFSRVGHAFVPGERAFQTARLLGFAPERIQTGLYGCDAQAFRPAFALRQTRGRWPRRFLFVGRLVPDKGVETLLEAYRQYRSRAADPWALSVCGAGPLSAQLGGIAGLDYRGFVEPAGLVELFATHGALVMPSVFEPWGVAMAEGAIAGLPVIGSSACGAAVEILRDYYSGRVVAPGDAGALAEAMHWIDANEAALPVMGQRSAELAAAFSAQATAARWAEFFLQLAAQKAPA